LIQCITDESPNKSYVIQFQIVKSTCISIENEGSTQTGTAKNHVILEIHDRTAQLTIMVPFEKALHDFDILMPNGQTIKTLEKRIFQSTIQCLDPMQY
jgi:hypothetical protein